MRQSHRIFYRFGLIFLIIGLLIISQFTIVISAGHEWDKSSIDVSGECDNGIAIFTITNTGEPEEGDMDFESYYHIFRNDTFETNDTFQIDGGENINIYVDAHGDTIKMIAYQHPNHPGVGFSTAIVEDCGCPDSGDQDDDFPEDPDDNSSDTPDDNSSDVPDDNSSDVPDGNSSDVPDDNSSDTPDGNSSDVPDDNSSDVPDGNSSDVPDDNSSDVPDGNSSDVPDDNSSDTPDGNSSDVPDDNSSDIPDDNSSDVSDNNSSDIPDDNSSDVSDNNATTNTDDRSDDPTDTNQDPPTSDSNNDNDPNSNPPQKQYFYTGNKESPNEKPIAVVNIENNTQFYTDDTILFDGSKSYDADGNITKWVWSFEKEDVVLGEIISKTFDEQGIYTITLTVIDDDMAENHTSFTVIIEGKNIKPTPPEIIGKTNSFVGKNILFTIVSKDSNKDALQYIISWDDGTTTETEFYPQSTEITLDHTWKEPGTYTITVKAFDSQLYSSESSMTITIDEVFTANYGYIILLITAIFTFISLTTKTFFQDKAMRAIMP